MAISSRTHNESDEPKQLLLLMPYAHFSLHPGPASLLRARHDHGDGDALLRMSKLMIEIMFMDDL